MFFNNEAHDMVRKCGSSYAYCTGNCTTCSINNIKTTDRTEPTEYPIYKANTNDDFISKPTKEEYEASKKAKETICQCIYSSRKRQSELLDELCEERACEKDYLGMYEAHKNLIKRYELYEEAEAHA